MANFRNFAPLDMDMMPLLHGTRIAVWRNGFIVTSGPYTITFRGNFHFHQVTGELMGNISNYTVELGGAVIQRITDLRANLTEYFDVTTAMQVQRLFAERDDLFVGSAGEDVLYGFDGDDRMFGLGGDDELIGGRGTDALHGQGGNDTLRGADHADWLFGDSGNDRLNGGTGNDRLDGGAQNDLLVGGGGKDILWGGSGADRIYGGDGDDILHGGGGNDKLLGGADADDLNGNAGRDLLVGGTGADTFNFVNGGGRDAVRDFEDNVDTLVLDSRLWGGDDMSVRQVLNEFAEVRGGNTVLDFGGGDKIILQGIDDPSLLLNDITIANWF